jgi:tetratricopeptide (TPR) repeat protein
MLHSLLLLPLLLTGRLDSPVTDRAEQLAKQALARGNEVRGAAPLIRLHALLDEVDDLNLLAEPEANLAWRGSTEPHVRLLARLFQADVERARGRTVKARELMDELNFVQDFYVVGGFDNEGKGGCDTDFGPEASLDLKASYPAQGRALTWARLPVKSLDGFVDLSVPLRPNSDAVGYALTFLQADAETRVVLSLGTSGAARLFVNGQKVLSHNRYNLPRVDQSKVAVTLRRGVNRVLVKVCGQGGPFGFYLRQERADSPRAGARVTLPESVPPLERGAAPQPTPVPTLVELLEARVKAQPRDAEAHQDLATVLAWSRAFDETEHLAIREADAATALAPKSAEFALTAAAMTNEDSNRRRALLEQAVALEPKHPFARYELAQHELQHEHADRALPMAQSLLADAPHFAEAALLEARALEALGEHVAALRLVEDTFRAEPFIPVVAREAIGVSRRLDRSEEAAARARMALALRFDDVNTRRGLATLLTELGHVDEAVDQYRKVLALDPFDTGSVLRLAEVLAANGHFDEARRLFADARTLAPAESDGYEREGRALLHAGERDAALLAFSTALKLKPQNPALKELVRSLRGDDTNNPSAEAMALAPLLEEAKTLSGEDAISLADVTSVRVLSSGLASRFQQVVVKVLTERGVEAWRQLPITYSPDRQEVRVVKVRITKADGSIVDSYGDQDRNMNEPWTGMYYDARARVLTFPTLSTGDVLEVQWRLDDTSVENLLADYWGDVDAVQSVYPKRHYRYVVDMPQARKLYWNEQTAPKWLKAESHTEADRTLYRFEATNVARVVPEPQMPGWAEISSPLHLSTYATWDDVGRYWWGLVREQLLPDEELKKTVDGLLKGIDRNDTQKVVAALYGFVVTNTRYVALEFGIHGYKPYRVDRVLARRFGDCKDKASLIVAMLKVAGVDARLVLLRMRHLGRLAPEPASLAAFNHAIAYVPKLDLYLDGTAEFYGSHELPSADRVANVLVVEPEGKSRLLTTPEARPEENLTTFTLAVTLKVDGSAQAKGSMVATGQSAPELRRSFATPATRQTVFEQQFAQSFPGVSASEVTLSDPKNLETPVTLGFTMKLPRYSEAGGGLLRFYPFGAGRTFTQALAPLSERKSDAVFSAPFVNRFAFTYALPPGWSVGELPAPLVEASPFGVLRLTPSKKEGALLVEGELVMQAARVSAKDYPAFRAWLIKVDQAFGHKLVVQQKGASTTAAR